MIKVVVFDFDGTLMDSEPIKQASWTDVFEDDPHIGTDLIRDTLARNVGNRFDILRDILVRAGTPSDQIGSLINEYAARYDDIVQRGIAVKGLAAGAEEVIDALSSRHCLYINSGTPEPSLRATVENLGIDRYFKAVLGAPPTKEENLGSIIGREGVDAREVVMIGDRDGDLHAARSCDTHFIGIANDLNQWHTADFPVAAEIRGIDKIIGTL